SASWATAASWDPTAGPASMWIAKLSDKTNSPKTAVVSASSTVRRISIDGTSGGGAMTVAIQTGATLTASSDIQINAAGMIDLQGGTLSSPAIQMTGGSLIGNGTVTGNLASAGAVSPGHSIGSVSITGSYT